MSNLLIIFVKNPVAGKVKTRLARSVGEEKALSVYLKLMEKTKAITRDLPLVKQVAYSDFVAEEDLWDAKQFLKTMQLGDDLGERMKKAIDQAIEQGYKRVCLIGSDLYELSSDIIERAFALLEENDVVLGPAIDGGYYLIGVTKMYDRLFENKRWGSSSVLNDTLNDTKDMNLKYALLPPLNDIDELEDIKDEDRDYLLS